jgi:hypothetical protein
MEIPVALLIKSIIIINAAGLHNIRGLAVLVQGNSLIIITCIAVFQPIYAVSKEK